jgi:hypothetical protein
MAELWPKLIPGVNSASTTRHESRSGLPFAPEALVYILKA